MWRCAFIFIMCLIICSACQQKERIEPKEKLPTQIFIENQLLHEDWLQTDLHMHADIYLSESVGLWLQFLVEQHDEQLFKKQVNMLEKHFLMEGNTVSWKIMPSDRSSVNALVDDLRIMQALYNGAALWNEKSYEKIANKIAASLASNNMKNGIFIDFYDAKTKSQADSLTMSYIIPEALVQLKIRKFITEEEFTENMKIVFEEPLGKDGFFPQTYLPSSAQYLYKDEINLIDQYYMGYHRAKWQADVSELVSYTKSALEKDGRLYGRIQAKTKQPLVQYESPAVYALAILMMIELEQKELAQQLYNRLLIWQVQNEASPYYGGYVDEETGHTHIFDNLLPLLAERRGKDAKIF